MVLRATQIWKTNAENSCGLRLQALQTDNAGEFLGKKWTKMVQDAGFNHYTSAPYAPSMNSYAERVIRTVVGHASSMLWTAGIREDFWALAAKASVYLLNRSPHKGLDITPYEMWFNTKPHLGHIRTWGCRAWAAVPKERRKKFDARSRECILVGFYDTENLYQLWDIEAKELVKRRDVIFHEHTLGHPSLTRSLQTGTSKTNIMGHDVESDLDTLHNEYADGDEDLEELYPVIESLKCEEWEGVPESYLPITDDLLSESVPKTYKQAINGTASAKWLEAIKSEHDSLQKNGVYEWTTIPPGDNHTILPCRWLFVIKRKADGSVDRYKARLVAGGHKQKEGIDFKETYAPVAKFVSLRVLLTFVALEDLEGEQVDIVTTFLNGDLEETVYMKAPEGIPCEGSKVVWRLKKSLYGLRQSPRCFYMKLDEILAKKGYVRVPADYGVWILRKEVVLLVHVDDMQLFGTRNG